MGIFIFPFTNDASYHEADGRGPKYASEKEKNRQKHGRLIIMRMKKTGETRLGGWGHLII
jgi:hypothetical protein